MNLFIAGLLGLLAYVIANVLLSNVESLKPRAEIIAFVIGILVALFMAGMFK